jgi:hypothetical protein
MKKCIPIFIIFIVAMNYMMISFILNHNDLCSSIMLIPWSILILSLGIYSGKAIYQNK